MAPPILEVDRLQVVFHTPLGDTYAVQDVSFRIERGQMYGIVGESGCGKSMTGRAILRLVPPPGEIVGGRIMFDGEDLLQKSEHEMRELRGGRISMVFQDPSAALNPLFTVGQQLIGVMKHHRNASREALRRRAVELLAELGLPNSEEFLHSYPHMLSGGMQQRVMIAMALSTEPDLIIADEPTSALDVTIQAQILDLLVRLQRERHVAIMLITHDLGIVAETCEEVAVFYLGMVAEQGSVRAIYHDTKHPYTQGLLAALPTPSRWGDALKVIPGTVPTRLVRTAGCPFASRCEYTMPVCRQVAPPVAYFGDRHLVACHLHTGVAVAGEGQTR